MKPIKGMRCKRCGYEWWSKSEMVWVTCPSCSYRSAKPIDKEEDDSHQEM